MIRKTIPVLVHEDCMDSISVGLAKQEANIAKIAENTTTVQSKLNDIAEDTNTIEGNTTAIKTSSANASTTLSQIHTDTDAIRGNSEIIKSSVGFPADSASSKTVIGLLKSISNRITTF